MKAANDNEAAWREFHEANPQVYSLIERFTKQAINAGYTTHDVDHTAGAVAYG